MLSIHREIILVTSANRQLRQEVFELKLCWDDPGVHVVIMHEPQVCILQPTWTRGTTMHKMMAQKLNLQQLFALEPVWPILLNITIVRFRGKGSS